MTCKGICQRHKEKKPHKKSRYDAGQKRCTICMEYLQWNGLFCPCCNMRLRGTSRHTKYQENISEVRRVP
ncbi:MAG: hypothetical protein ACR2LL_06555 [Nitrosopumilus sp.]